MAWVLAFRVETYEDGFANGIAVIGHTISLAKNWSEYKTDIHNLPMYCLVKTTVVEHAAFTSS